MEREKKKERENFTERKSYYKHHQPEDDSQTKKEKRLMKIQDYMKYKIMKKKSYNNENKQSERQID